jgi:DNA polymerase I-like protein with 3'-5' exonuclease and polymerase domains
MSKLNDAQIYHANRWGYVETVPDTEIDPNQGYRLYCPRGDGGKVLETVPLNYHVQGTACWVMMRAMDKVQDYLSTLNDSHIALQIHDELVLDMPYVPNRGNLPKIRKVQHLMSKLGENISVPLTVGVEYHEHNWRVGVAC